jgi:HAD superfamily hydrolase (TIGR01484 family)
LIAFATARDFRFVTEHISPLTSIIPDILIADNGALTRYNGVDIYKKTIPKKTVKALMSQFKPVRCVSTEDAYYLSGDFSNDHWSIGKKSTIITDFSTEMKGDAFYVDGNADKSHLSLIECYSEVRTVSYSDVDLITVVHHEATKLNALNAVKNVLNIELSEIAVFGDDYSDISIIKNGGVGVAVANAIDEVKAVADYICGTNDNDGVAKWIEEHLI